VRTRCRHPTVARVEDLLARHAPLKPTLLPSTKSGDHQKNQHDDNDQDQELSSAHVVPRFTPATWTGNVSDAQRRGLPRAVSSLASDSMDSPLVHETRHQRTTSLR